MRDWLRVGDKSILNWCSTRCTQYSEYAVLGVCCTRCYRLIMACRDREGWLNFVFLGDGRVEDKKERDWGTHHVKLGLKRIWCARRFTTPDTAGTSPNPACSNTDRRSSQPKQASHTRDFSYPLVSSTSFWSPSPISLSRPQLYHHRRTQS